jgi:hypothetical protein
MRHRAYVEPVSAFRDGRVEISVILAWLPCVYAALTDV